MQRYCYLAILAFLLPAVAGIAEPGTAFSYQGHLEDDGTPINGTVSLRFSLYDEATTGSLVAGPITHEDTLAAEGMVDESLDFGAVFDGSPRWMQVDVDPDGGTDAFETVLPRIQILPVPYAVHAATAGTAADDNDRDPTNELQSLSAVLAAGSDASGLEALNLGRVQIPGSTGSGNHSDGQTNSALRIGVDGGLNDSGTTDVSYGNLAIGNYQIFTDGFETAKGAPASQGLVVQAQDNPDALGEYQLFSVQSSGDANRFSVIHGMTGFASQFKDSLAVGSGGEVDLVYIDSSADVDFGTDGAADLWVADDIEAGGTVYAAQFEGDGSKLTGIDIADDDSDPTNELEYVNPGVCQRVINIPDWTNYHYMEPGEAAYQIWTAPRTSNIVKLRALWRTQTNPATVEYWISSSGTVIGHGQVSGDFTYGWYSMPLDHAVPVREGRTYNLTMSADADWIWYYDRNNPYADGRSSIDPRFDFNMSTYETLEAPVFYLEADDSKMGLFRDTTVQAFQVGTTSSNGNGAYLTPGGTWTNASSRALKEGFLTLDKMDVLQRIVDLPVTRWSYIGSSEGEHVGPVAEDFYAAFGLGDSDKAISTTDANGITIAALQGLNAKLEEENADLRNRVDELENRLKSVEEALAKGN
ncbi:tail fiber domain-containing protein [bacterium]|nr:tail fiber domain-containing protein [bacterium]